MKKTIDMTKCSISKGIIIFALPLMLSNILQVLFNMSDLIVVGNFAGENSLGAVGSTTTIVSLFTGLLIGMGAGVNVITAKRLGSGDKEGLSKVIHTSFLVTLIFGIIICIIGLFSSRFLLELLKTKETLIDKAEEYLKIYLLGIPALAIYNYGQGILSAEGNTVKPLIYLGISGVVNICLNLILVICFNLDVVGVAIASAVAQYLSMVLIIISLLRSKTSCKLRINEIKINLPIAKELLIIGIAGGIQNSIFAVANSFIQFAVNTFDDITVSGNAAAQNFDTLVYEVLAAIYMAGATFVGQNFGANNKKRIWKTYLLTQIYSFIIGIAIGILLFIFSKPFLRIFSDETSVIEAALPRMKIMALSYFLSAFMDAPIAASRGLGKALVPVIIEVLGSCILRIVWVYTIFMKYRTIASLYYLYPVSWLSTGIFETIYFIFIYKKLKKSN